MKTPMGASSADARPARRPMAPTRDPNAWARTLVQVAADEGLAGALALLNGWSSCRFTGAYRFAPHGGMTLIAGYDRRQRQALPLWLPLDRAAAQFVAGAGFVASQAEGAGFVIPLAAMPRQVKSFYGAELLDMDGEPVGCLCHFHPRSVALSHDSADLLRRAGGMLWPALSAHEGPSHAGSRAASAFAGAGPLD